MIWGTNDGALDKKLADLSGDHVDNYTVHYIEGASHWVHQEEPDQVNAFIHEFLQSRWAQWIEVAVSIYDRNLECQFPSNFCDCMLFPVSAESQKSFLNLINN